MGRTVWRWMKRVVAALVLLIAALAIAGAAYQAIAEASERSHNPPPGKLIDVGGFKLHVFCVGSGAPGRPTVILESGLASTTPIWTLVQSEVARSARVCAYDRAGIGWSERSPHPRDAVHIASELHALLAAAQIAPPYVLVAHSSGGLYVRTYQRLYPVGVAGMVLLDTTPERLALASEQTRRENANTTSLINLTPILARLGVLRIMSTCGMGLPADFPRAQAGQYLALCNAAAPWAVEREEHAHISDALPPGPPITVPLGVFTAGKNVKRLGVWGSLQDKLAQMSPNHLQRVFPGADHASFLVEKRYAHETAILIAKVVRAAETHAPLH